MAKASGLGQRLYVTGVDLSGDTGSFDGISTPTNMLDVTDITQGAHARLGGERDGSLSWTSFFDPALAAAHAVLSTLPTTDVPLMMLAEPPALGSAALCMVAKQIGYDPTRPTDASLTFKLDAQANGFGGEWAKMLTAGIRTDTAATNGTAVDTTASAAFGLQAYLQVFGFTGTDATVKLQDSADNVTFTDLASAAFTQITASTPQGQRIAIANNATVRRYVRASTITTGGFTSLPFAVAFIKNPIAGQLF